VVQGAGKELCGDAQSVTQGREQQGVEAAVLAEHCALPNSLCVFAPPLQEQGDLFLEIIKAAAQLGEQPRVGEVGVFKPGV
jgi:hypothetical protein